MTRRSVLLVLVVSGAAALIYEVAWTRLLTLQLGHGVAAASTVLAAFMGGLALGAALAARRADRLSPRAALLGYAVAEFGIALLALWLPIGLRLSEPLLTWAYADGDGGSLFAAARLAISLLLVSLPACAMGATFPFAWRWAARDARHAGHDAGALYAANTVGAAAGAVLAGFVLLPQLGLAATTWVAVGLNLLAASAALWLRRQEPLQVAFSESRARPTTRTAAPKPPGSRKDVDDRTVAPAAPWLAAAAVGVTGFASLVLQVVWTRLLAMILGPTTYAFSLTVAIFVAGLAIGAALGARVAARSRTPAVALMLTMLAASVGALGAAAAVDRSLLAMAEISAAANVSFSAVLLREAAIVVLLLAPMAIAFGAAFPLAVAVATRRDETMVTDLGAVYTVNTAGAILGALAAGFVLIPLLGLATTLRAVASALALAALAAAWLSAPRRPRLGIVPAAVAALAAAWVVPLWTPALLASGGYKYAAALRGPDLATGLTAGELRFYREGATATVAVKELTGTRSLAIDGKVDASNGGDMLTQRLLAHVPLLLHPAPKEVAIIGLGSGVTLGSALRHPIARASVLEISPEVVAASALFVDENHDGLHDARTRLIVGDGRSHLLLGRQRYDVIVSEPSNPWMAGVATLFTRDFFLAARERLAPDGVLCQWAHTYDISDGDLRSIVATFLSVFPDGTLWLVGDGDILLVGSPAPLTAGLERIAAGGYPPAVATDLATVGVTSPFGLLSLFVADGARLQAWAGDAVQQTDDHTPLEFSGPRTVFGRTAADNAAALRTLGDAGEPPAPIAGVLARASAAEWRDRGTMLARAEAFRPAYDSFRRSIELDATHGPAFDGLLRSAVHLNRTAETRGWLEALAGRSGANGPPLALSRLLASTGAYDEAMRIPLTLIQRDPSDVAALEQLASIVSDVGDATRLAAVVARLRAVTPDTPATHYYAAALAFLQGRPALAEGEARAAIAAGGDHSRAYNVLGAALASQGRRDDARAAFQRSIAIEARDPATYANLGTLELEAGNRVAAAHYFSSALLIDPSSAAARDGLASSRR